ncbi:hypothetical protein TRIUR3_29832 [Triticum urartu]|uniref:Uncharacterized protein n=1 Tax=Triticum urartu TaxID=4572 RepID=M7ZNC7_TRIUA|nr:hypothetical protein TRIUR3_29832 [Triticum urartu]
MTKTTLRSITNSRIWIPMLAPTCSSMISSDEPRCRGFNQSRIQFPLSIGHISNTNHSLMLMAKEANAQEKFLRIKHAYNTLMNSESRSKYASSSSSPDSWWSPGSSKPADAEEDFYGFGDFLKDLQTEFQNWEAGLNSEQKPKSLWEELSAIGEEFVEFLENELNIDGSGTEEDDGNDPYTQFGGKGGNAQGDKKGTSSSDDGVSDIESVLEQLKKELGLS